MNRPRLCGHLQRTDITPVLPCIFPSTLLYFSHKQTILVCGKNDPARALCVLAREVGNDDGGEKVADILAAAELILARAGDISNLVILAAVLAAAAVGMAEYKSKLWSYITNRRNKWWFMYLLLTLAAVVFMRVKGWLGGGWLITVSVLWLLYGIACVQSLKPKQFMGFTDPVLRRYEKWLFDGSSIEHIAYFRRTKPWYFCTAEDRLDYYMLACLYFADVKEFENALHALDRIQNVWLYESEKETIKLQRALLLAQMGSMKAAFRRCRWLPGCGRM